ncbi:MAG: hypothetical protein ACREQ5_00225 [Candidatus Dormibacteria bacterium]
MLILGIVLVVVFGWLAPISILFDLGVLLLILGVIFEVLGYAGRPVLGRRHYW